MLKFPMTAEFERSVRDLLRTHAIGDAAMVRVWGDSSQPGYPAVKWFNVEALDVAAFDAEVRKLPGYKGHTISRILATISEK